MKFIKLVLTLSLISLTIIYAQHDTLTTESGLKYIILKQGNGVKVKKGNKVSVHYTGRFLDGKKFDSSYDRNEPLVFDVLKGRMIKGFDEGVALMSVGDKYRFIIPFELGYGENNVGNIPGKSTLVFDVEVLNLQDFGVPITDILWNYFNNHSAEETILYYKTLKTNFPNKYDFRENQLRELGFLMIQNGKVDDAIKIFEFNKTLFPNSGYVFDSLGEAYIMQFKIDEAIKYYKLALQKDSTIANSKKMLKLLLETKRQKDSQKK